LSVELIQICGDAEMNRHDLFVSINGALRSKGREKPHFILDTEGGCLRACLLKMMSCMIPSSISYFEMPFSPMPSFFERVTFWQPFGINLVKVTLKEASVCHSYITLDIMIALCL
jgi:hypothetical protein